MTNIVFFGTPELSVPFLSALLNDKELTVSLVVTQAGKPSGRTQEAHDSPIKSLALTHNLPVLEPASLKDPLVEEAIRVVKPDLFVVFAYGLIIPESILSLATLGAINVHPSRLPLYRGPSPMQSAILNSEQETAISIMLMDAKMDHGPVLASKTIPLTEQTTYDELETTVMTVGPSLLLKTIHGYLSKTLAPVVQDHNKATFCPLLTKTDGLIDWNTSAKLIDAKRRAYSRFPGIYTSINSMQTKIIDSAPRDETNLAPGEILIDESKLFIGTGKGVLEILALQPAGKKQMSTSEYLRGVRGKLEITR